LAGFSRSLRQTSGVTFQGSDLVLRPRLEAVGWPVGFRPIYGCARMIDSRQMCNACARQAPGRRWLCCWSAGTAPTPQETRDRVRRSGPLHRPPMEWRDVPRSRQGAVPCKV